MPMLEQPTAELRFVQRGEARVLQQRWRMPYQWRNTVGDLTLEYEYEWRDVPLVEDQQ